MIYLIGGASRAGKTYLSKKLMARLDDTPILELDYLKMGLANGLPEYGVNPLDDEETIGRLLWPIVSAMITAMVENEDDYIIEGTYVLPRFAAESHERHGEAIRSCFLGYEAADVAEKLAEIRKYGGEPGDPLRDYDDEAAGSDLERFVAFSAFVRAECDRLGLVYFEVRDREQAVQEAMRNLLHSRPSR